MDILPNGSTPKRLEEFVKNRRRLNGFWRRAPGFQSLRRASILAAVLVSTLGGHHLAQAEQLPSVVIGEPDAQCSEEFTAQLVEELRVRTGATIDFASVVSDHDVTWRLAVATKDDTSCEVRIENAEDSRSFITAKNAEPIEIASVANRLAWIIDEPPDQASSSPANSADQPSEEASDIAGLEMEDLTFSLAGSDETTTWSRSDEFSLQTIGGALWLPSMESTLMLARVGGRWQPKSHLGFELLGRIPLGVATSDVESFRFHYRPWAIGLATTYNRPLSSQWSLRAGTGVRWTHFEVSASALSANQQQALTPNTSDDAAQNASEGHVDDAARNDGQEASTNYAQDPSNQPAQGGSANQAQEGAEPTPPVPQARVTGQTDSTLYNALSPWAFKATVGVGYGLRENVALRMDVTGATSLARRQIRDNQGVIMSLGRFELDVLAGVEWSF